ncbi:hypothetical protein ASG87_15110 [Frateuria sp. Soil773]|uniref:hypothetical protein n=1 Tax=Frateuria sp. Soil773 TaxID=1736407 RepID=UPI0007012E0A|nr:hypothetical protein [Frateuria sp. Soil773]KRE97850.1 hypothetical protein ASG87_15110 [Frateuria sp. Soil773]
MRRRDLLKGMALGPAALSLARPAVSATAHGPPADGLSSDAGRFASQWHRLPDMPWTGEDLWAQRLQDWCIRDGELVCLHDGPDRTVHVLTHQLGGAAQPFVAEASLRFAGAGGDARDAAGFRLGVQGRYRDNYRSAIVTGKGVDVGITRAGVLFVGAVRAAEAIDPARWRGGVRLRLAVDAQAGAPATLQALDLHGALLGELRAEPQDAGWQGNIALLSHAHPRDVQAPASTVAFAWARVEGGRLLHRPEQAFGAVYFAQYTVHAGTLKLSAQLAPIDRPGLPAVLEIERDGRWQRVASAVPHPLARVAAFRVPGWDARTDCAYRVRLALPLKDAGEREYAYAGRIAAEPSGEGRVRALLFSCNWDIGFPDEEVVANVLKQHGDLALFVGDQFYEANGGFGIQKHPLEQSTLDYLRKWIQFGWSYRDVFRAMPSAFLLDDHDMYHGNLWGCGGRPAVERGSEADIQDSGGYKMPAGWVNMAQITQTSHMPDPYDPAPVGQGIGVYYTHWEYAGVSFGIVEDRKFKSVPKDVLPPEAKVWNGYAQNPDYDPARTHWLQAQLLGERQMQFLGWWNHRWEKSTRFKVLLSATPLCCLQTLPAGAKDDEVTAKLAIPEPGSYVQGDAPTRDMDSNGWPQNRRDDVLRLLRKNFTLHMTGDQHMASVVQYGVDDYGDSGFAFSGPALGNIWPRRWWPPVGPEHRPLPGRPRYTGDFRDGFGNRMTVHAVANPARTGREPALLYDRATGYAVVDFDAGREQVTMHCWPRFADPDDGPQGQYPDWPITLDKTLHARPAAKLAVTPIALDPARRQHIRVVHLERDELVCQVSLQAASFVPPLHHRGRHAVFLTDHESNLTRRIDIHV